MKIKNSDSSSSSDGIFDNFDLNMLEDQKKMPVIKVKRLVSSWTAEDIGIKKPIEIK